MVSVTGVPGHWALPVNTAERRHSTSVMCLFMESGIVVEKVVLKKSSLRVYSIDTKRRRKFTVFSLTVARTNVKI